MNDNTAIDDMDLNTSDTELTLSRTFDAPLHRVYRAFTDPDELAKWYQPGPGTPDVHALDPQPGGDLSVTMHTQEGDHTINGTFEEVEEDERLVHTWRWAGDEESPESRVTITFTDVDEGTEVVLTHERLPNEESVQNHAEGWIGCLANLEAAL